MEPEKAKNMKAAAVFRVLFLKSTEEQPTQHSHHLFFLSAAWIWVFLKCTLHFKWKACLRKNYLLGNVNQRRSSKQSKGVQGDNDHLGGGVGCHQLLQQLPGAGGQARIVVHVLQNRDQLQLQVHRCGQTYNKERNTGRISPWAGFFWQFWGTEYVWIATTAESRLWKHVQWLPITRVLARCETTALSSTFMADWEGCSLLHCR